MMKRLVYILFALVSCVLTTVAQTSNGVDTYNFEDATSNAQWQFIQSSQTNYWTIGTAAGSTPSGSNALYITNNGSTYYYNTSSSSVSWAYLPVTLAETDTISFSWKAYGESSYDYIAAYLVPVGATLPSAGSGPLSSYVALSTRLNLQSDWQYAQYMPQLSGEYYLMFMWKNDGSAGSTPAGAIDNVYISGQRQEASLPKCGDNVYWELVDGTLTISGSGPMYDYASASSVPWYSSRTSITNVVVQDGVTTIGNNAFYDHSVLNSVSLPNSLTTIGNYAFYSNDALYNITLPANLTAIGNYAFRYCDYLRAVWVETVTPPTIGSYLFSSSPTCYVPRGTQATYTASSWASYVGAWKEQEYEISCFQALQSCTTTVSLEKYIIRGYITELTQAYSDDNASVSFWMADDVNAGKVLYIEAALPLSSDDQSVELGDYVEVQGHLCLYNALPKIVSGGSVEHLTAPSSDSTMLCGDSLYWYLSGNTLHLRGTGAMYNYSSANPAPWDSLSTTITTVILPEGLTRIGNYAFANCTALNLLATPTTVTKIGDYAFYNCTSLASALITNNVDSIGKYAFYYCSALTQVYMQATTPPLLGKQAFYVSASVYVPTGATSTYQASDWSNYSSSFSQADKKCGDNLYWTYGSNTLIVVGFGSMYNYSSSSAPWYSYRSSIRNVYLPDGLTNIGNYAFYGCSNLKAIALPQAVTSIGTYAFNSASSLASINIPESVTSIGINAFVSTQLYSDNANWENKVLYIGNNLIAANTSISGAYSIRENTKVIADRAFYGCSSLTSIEFPTTLSIIPLECFYNCSSLTKLDVPGNITTISNYAFYNCNNLKFINLSEGLESIGSYAFYYCSTLPFITIPSTVISIGANAFYGNSTLSSLYMLPTTAPTLGASAFNSSAVCYVPCGAVGTYLASSVWSNMFGRFTELCHLDSCHTFDSSEMNAQWQFIQDGQTNQWTIGTDANSVSINNHALYITNDGSTYAYDNSSASVSWACLPVTLASTDSISFYWKARGETCCDYAYAYLFPADSLPTAGSAAVPTSAIAISGKLNQQLTWQHASATPQVSGNYNLCFMWVNDESSGDISVVIDDLFIGAANAPASPNKCGDNLVWTLVDSTLTITGTGAMYDYAKLTMIPWYSQRTNIATVSLPSQLTSISSKAFYGCTNLRGSIVLPDSITEVGDSTFYNCQRISSVTLPSGVTKIGAYAFYSCNSLSSINIPASVNSIGTYAFYYCYNLTSINIPEGVATIPASAFNYCSGLSSVVIPNTVTNIETEAFRNCSALTTVTIGSSVDTIAGYAFYNTSLNFMYVLAQTPPTLLGSYPLYSSPKCYIPAGTLASYQASSWASYVSSFVERGQCGENLYYTIENNTLSITGSGAMYDFSIQNPAPWFEQRSSFSAVSLPEGLTTIGAWAFYDCDAVLSFSLPSSVTSIGTGAFNDCAAITSVSLSENLDSIGSEAFANCSELSTVYVNAFTPPALGDSVFSATEDITCYVPCGRYSTYEESAWAEIFASLEQDCNAQYVYDFDDATLNAQWQFIQNGQTNYWTIGTSAGSTPSGSNALYITNNGSAYNYSNYYSSVSWAYIPVSLSTSDTISFSWKAYGESCCDYIGVYLVPVGSTLPSAGSTSIYDATTLAEKLNVQSSWLNAQYTPQVSGEYYLMFMWRNDGSAGSSPAGAIDNVRVTGNSTNQCGNNLYWELLDSDEESFYNLSITGSGDMYVYSQASHVPWYNVRQNIKSVSLPEDLTSIGSYSFVDCDNIASVTIPASVTSIGGLAFYDCGGLDSLVIPEGTTTIGEYAFYNCTGMFTATISSTVTAIGSYAFASCSNLDTIYVNASTPPTIDTETFTSTPVCYVPCGSIYAYLSSSWANQVTLYEQCDLPTTGITHTFEDATLNAQWYTIQSSQYNYWIIGTAAGSTPAGSNALYITKNGSSHNYNTSYSSTSWVYTPVALNTTDTISFSWMANGESCCDYLAAYLLPMGSTLPSAGSTSIYDATTLAEKLNGVSTWQHVQYVPEVSGNYYLMFMWHNDGSAGSSPAGAIDNVRIICEGEYTPEYFYYDTVVCHGSSYYWELTGEYYSESGTYTYTDSLTDVHTLTLTVSPEAITRTVMDTIYDSQSYEWYGSTYYSPGVYTYTEQSVHGCDSIIHTLYLTVLTQISNYHTFEDATLNAQWQFVQDGQSNFWTIGTAAGSATEGSNALYVTNDGYSYSYYFDYQSTSWAYIPVTLTESDAISFYLKGTGEGSYDYVQVYLIPVGSMPTAGSTSAPSNAIYLAQISGYSDWQYFTYYPYCTGEYNLFFMWRNDGSVGGTPIAIDDVSAGMLNVPAANSCGENLMWQYADGTLTISGTGAMYDDHELLSYRQQSWFPSGLYQVNLPEGITHIGATAFADCQNLTSISIPSNVTSIGEAAFANSGLQSIELPSSVQDIHYMAFAKCQQLTSFVYRGTPSTLGNATAHMFLGCHNLETIVAHARFFKCDNPNTSLQSSYSLPTHVKYIEITAGTLTDNALSYIALSKNTLLSLDVSATDNMELPAQAFAEYTALQNLSLPANLSAIPSQMAYGCTSLQAISIPTYVQTIGEWAFGYCSSLQSIDFADYQNLQTIDYVAFAYCILLPTVDIPEGVSVLGSGAFYGCTSLVKLRLPSTLTYISNQAFEGCYQLLKMNVAAYTPPTIYDETAFLNVPRTANVYVPDAVVNDYKNAYIWSEFYILSDVQDGLEDIEVENQEGVQKLLIDGNVLIIKNGKLYNLMGQEINL